MMRRWRPAFLVLALLLTVAALNLPVRAVECEDGDHDWVNLGDCCWQLYPPPGKLFLTRCIGGEWVVYPNIYKCPPTEPCG